MTCFSDYLNSIARINCLAPSGSVSDIVWFFHCGMVFSSPHKWWADFKTRKTAHEGIDITWYAVNNGRLRQFDENIRVPAMDNGRIVNICDDFLGKTIVVDHTCSKSAGKRFVFAYAHIIPEKGIEKGSCLKKDQVIAKICNTVKNPLLAPHLHFSCIEIEKNTPAGRLDWNLFTSQEKVNLINPVFL